VWDISLRVTYTNPLSFIQNLRNRMNYVLKLTEWDESDLQPLMDETDMLLAKHLPVIITASNA
jgi:hypothetical protein